MTRMKELKEDADRYAAAHMAACEDWPHGKVVEAGKDEEGNICIQYEDGSWFHYKEASSGLKWW